MQDRSNITPTFNGVISPSVFSDVITCLQIRNYTSDELKIMSFSKFKKNFPRRAINTAKALNYPVAEYAKKVFVYKC